MPKKILSDQTAGQLMYGSNIFIPARDSISQTRMLKNLLMCGRDVVKQVCTQQQIPIILLLVFKNWLKRYK